MQPTEAASDTDACYQSRKHANVSWGKKEQSLFFSFIFSHLDLSLIFLLQPLFYSLCFMKEVTADRSGSIAG